MVNSPSRLNSRPVAPPPPGGCVRHNVALPPRGVGTARPHVFHTVHVPRISVVGCFPFLDLKSSPPCVARGTKSGNRNPIFPALKAQSRQKPQQSRLIKPYQGKRHISHATRHPAQELPHLCTSAFICGQIPPFCAFCVFRGYPPDHRNPKSVPGSPPIKAENPCNRA